MPLVTRYSPIGLHFGSLDTRLLQLTGSPRGWTVRAAESAAAQGMTRQSEAATSLSTRLKGLTLGKDAALATTIAHAGMTVVPIDQSQTERLRATLEEAAARSLEDSEGINYRYLPLNHRTQAEQEREEYLLLCLGQSEQRRCTAACDAMGLRPVGLELAAFPLARALTYAERDQKDSREAVGFLHLGFDHAFFGIASGNDMRFLKPIERNGADLLSAMQNAAEPLEDPHADVFGANLLAPDADVEEEDNTVTSGTAATMLAHVKRQAEEQGAMMLRTLRAEGASLGQEIRACLRYFHARNPGISVGRVELTGFGAGLPSLTDVLEQSLKIDVELAQPFTKIGISAPAEILREQHLWCTPLGLALREAA